MPCAGRLGRAEQSASRRICVHFERHICRNYNHMRINKYLAEKNYATRRGADELIKKGLVLINGRRAVLGDQVTEKDKVEVSRKAERKDYIYLAYNKPEGI